MKAAITTVAAVLACLLTGCAQLRLPPQDESPLKIGQARSGGRAGPLLLYADYVRNLSAADYGRELDNMRQIAAKDKSDFRQLQYALALLMPGGDARKAQQLIDAFSKEGRNPDPELVALANLINADLAERRRLEASSRRADDLEKKLEAMKNIEMGLIQRDKSSEGK